MHASALGTVEEVQLENGLRLLLAPEPESEVFTIMLWVPAGVRTEGSGQSGISHFVEHCYSLGSAKLAPREIDCVVQALGGSKNAFTSYDYTAFYANLPRSALARIIELEADRFLHPRFPPEAVQKELEVVKEERRLRTDDTVSGPANERLFDLAYRVHPYRNPIVGRPEDLARFDARAARQYFEAHYLTTRATFILVGGFDLDNAVSLFRSHFGSTERRGDPIADLPPEPALEVESRATLRREGVTNSLLSMMYRGPDIDHPDAPAMALLSTALMGGRAGRLQRSLIRKRCLASSVSGGFWALRDPGPFQLGLVPADGVSLSALEAAVDETIREFAEQGPSPDELARAKAQRLLSKLSALESTQGRAHALGIYQTTSRRGFRAHAESFRRLREVECEDLRRVARKYLVEAARAVVWQEPNRVAPVVVPVGRPLDLRTDCGEPRERAPAVARTNGPRSGPNAPSTPSCGVHPAPGEIERHVTDSGLVLLTQQAGRLPLCAIHMSVDAGACLDSPTTLGCATLTADTLRAGTDRLTEECVAEGFARFGTALSVSSGLESVQLRLVTRAEDVPSMLELMFQVLTRASFPTAVIERVRAEHLCRIRTAWSRPSELLHLGTLRALFDRHPYGRPVAGTPSGLESLRPEHVRAHYERHYRPERVRVALAGRFDAEEARAVIEESAGAWVRSDEGDAGSEVPGLIATEVVRSVAIHKEAQTQAHLALAQRVCPRVHEDWDKLVLFNALLGGSGLASRIPARVRTTEGLAYSARSSLSSRDLCGVLTISAQTRLEGVGRTLLAIEEELTRLLEGGLEDAEFERIKARLRGTLPFRTETVAAKASALLTAERNGLPLDYLEQQLERIEKLSRDEVLEAAARHLSWASFTQVVVAPEGPALSRCCEGLPTVRWSAEDFDRI